MYTFICATYLLNQYGMLDNNLSLVYIAEMTAGKHEFRLERIERITNESGDTAECNSNDISTMDNWIVKAPVCAKGTLSENLASGFPEAFQGFIGPKYEVIVYCATQIVNGTNHMLICEGVSTNGEKVVAKIILNETIPDEGKVLGHFSILSIEPIVISGGVGGWSVQLERWEGGSMPHPIVPGFEEAIKGFGGSKIVPLVFFGTQTVKGANHMIICKTTPTV